MSSIRQDSTHDNLMFAIKEKGNLSHKRWNKKKGNGKYCRLHGDCLHNSSECRVLSDLKKRNMEVVKLKKTYNIEEVENEDNEINKNETSYSLSINNVNHLRSKYILRKPQVRRH